MNDPDSKASFFRQSGWLVMATVGGGVFMMAVHMVASNKERMGTEEYGVLFILLRILVLLSIPAGALQTIFAQQAAAAVDEERSNQLAGTFRTVMGGILVLWIGLLGLTVAFKEDILAGMKITNEAALWITLMVALTTLWIPGLKGLLQGSQHFLGLGWVAIFDGVGRFLAICIIVLVLGGKSAGAMAGALIGQVVAIIAGAWWTRKLWWHRGAPPDWRRWLRRVLPLTLGPGAVLVLSTADAVYVRNIFPNEVSDYYAPGAMIGFAMLQFTLPVAMVMFPKIVNSVARAQKTDALKLTLLSTGVMGGLAALAATVLPRLPLQILYFSNDDMWQMAPLVPWFAWCMLALTLVNVLVSNLLARERYAIVPWLVILVVVYLATLWGLRDHVLSLERDAAFRLIVQVLTGFNLLAFALALWFTWGRERKPAHPAAQVVGGAG
jgi:O-antigen/teichoic acid export membrane protein